MTLTDFLLARIAEDETNARQLQHFERWTIDSDVKPEIETFANPARVLAECEAKRRIVAECVEGLRWDVACGEGHAGNLEIILSALALLYADHDDYSDEWRP